MATTQDPLRRRVMAHPLPRMVLNACYSKARALGIGGGTDCFAPDLSTLARW